MIFHTTSQDFFDHKYSMDQDPWNFATGAYELARYETTMRALQSRRYRRAFEPGCSIGVLTERLAAICDEVEAIDISPIAAAKARQRCEHLSGVTVRSGALPDCVPKKPFDLLVFSEIGYYFSESALFDLAKLLVQQTDIGGSVIGVHWLGISSDHILTGDRVHEVLRTIRGLKLQQEERYDSFRLDKWVRV